MYISFPPNDIKVHNLSSMQIPKMCRIRQIYDSSYVKDVEKTLLNELEQLGIGEEIFGKHICVTAGSRGIPDAVSIYRTICCFLKKKGAKPFLVPAMGSHGGATAEGQAALLEGYGITEESIGAPIRSSMEVVQYGEIHGFPLYVDKYAAEADGIIILNKVKPHTSFRGDHESGLAKMIAVGLAKHKGAASFHHLNIQLFSEVITKASEQFLSQFPVLCGIGVVQNAYDRICEVKAARKEGLLELDRDLLKIAKERIATLKFKKLDFLIIEEIGKNISGLGCDPNVTGRVNDSAIQGFEDILDVNKVFIAGLSEKTHHNGIGLYAADVTTARCLKSVDWTQTWTNVTTSTRLKGGQIPLYMNNDLEAIRLGLLTCNANSQDNVKVARIKNTQELEEIYVSEALWHEMSDRDDVIQISGFTDIEFDEDGWMKPVFTQ